MKGYINPPIEINSRNPISRHGEIYNLMVLRLHEGSRCDNPRVYDPTHHSVETRSSRLQHKTCTLLTPKTCAQRELQGTEDTFWKSAIQLKFADGIKNTIVPVYFSELEQQTSKILKSKQNFSSNPQNASQYLQNPTNYSLWNPNSGTPFNLIPYSHHPFNPQLSYPIGNPFGYQFQPPNHLSFTSKQNTLVSECNSYYSTNKNEEIEEEKSEISEIIPKDMDMEKMVMSLYEGQKQIQNQISSLISYVSNVTTKTKKDKKTKKADEEENKAPRRSQRKK